MLKIGITGGIGSGKTTACRIFETLGIPVYYADDRAKALMVDNPILVKNIKNLFGEQAYATDGSLNRIYIAEIAFHNPLKLKELNGVVHPAVWQDGEDWHNAQKHAPYTLKEAALLFESGGNKLMDKIITVVAPVEMRIERVLLRGGGTMSRSDVEARIAKQLSDEEKIKQSDFVISNDGSQALIPQILKIHQTLLDLK
ncbi:MAG: dephospho-CoA kinase [Saprospiraceae bacterium]|nr:dephospho-CoA kinase [Saprospiraceae bacterium]